MKESPRAAPKVAPSSSNSNQSAAEQLRQSLAAGKNFAPKASSKVDLPHELLEQRGRIQADPIEQKDDHAVVVDMPAPSSRAAKLIALGDDDEKEDTFATKMSVDEEMARNVLRLGKKRKYKMKTDVDSDEEERRITSMMMPEDPRKQKVAPEEKAKQRDQARQLAMSDKQNQIISKCWWWLESSQFDKQRLVSQGEHVSLVMAPFNRSLKNGHHFYLVPVKHSESFTACEYDVWDEVQRFQTSLRNLYEKEYKKCLIFSETVMPNKSFWQARMEAIPIKKKYWYESEMYFKTGLTEQQDENGTHTKLLSTKGKGLRRTIPKGFPYFYVEWDANSEGYAQIIESSDFPLDFAADTVAGMTGGDPLRFKKKQKFSPEEEREAVLKFLEKWKRYDWTEKLNS